MTPLLSLACLLAGGEATVDFARDVKPLIDARCLACHGPAKQRGGLRLDSRAAALAGGASGPAIVPGKAADSLFIKRLRSTDDSERMPAKAEALPAAEIARFAAWIDQGARWSEAATAPTTAGGRHWAYVAPRRPPLPAVRDQAWVRNPIDAFILARLERDGLKPAPPAERTTLIRRLALDLTGLPPSPAEVDAYLADRSGDAEARLVERLLASPHHGERWARPWLDLARYADTNGYERDKRRTIWPWRDWVIDALNRDLPFDQFTIEQLAGDLLPGATVAQRVATGFHRNSLVNDEDGSDKAEYRWLALIDRVATTATVWLGSTLACAQCHNHKFDPFTQRDFYRFLAFFEPAQEVAIEVTAGGDRRAAIAAELAAAKQALATNAPLADADADAWAVSVAAAAAAGDRDALAKLPKPVQQALATPAARRDAKARELIIAHHRGVHEATRDVVERIAELEKDLASAGGKATTLGFAEKPGTRATTVFHPRGAWLERGETVDAGLPACLPPLPSGPADRLALARWLVAPGQPLTARVTVNRIWETYFGRGLVETVEDFGTQSPPPSHPELLDWLAVEFVAGGWSLKKLHRLIVGSSTYRQASLAAPAARERDPDNRLLARFPRLRLEAELVRDNALAASNLLDRSIGGPSVFPDQPDGIWNIPYNNDRWTVSSGGDRWRRGLYTFIRRTAPHPMLATFDASSRECTLPRRSRSTTPLQALQQLNDSVSLEAARALARRALAEGGADERARLVHAFRCCTARPPAAAELQRLAALRRDLAARYASRADAARSVAGTGAWPVAPAEAAAWTLTANALLNLDETITRE